MCSLSALPAAALLALPLPAAALEEAFVRHVRPIAAGERGLVSAGCEVELLPDRAVIVGGVTARHLRPTQARAQLEQQLGEIESLVGEHGGTLKLLEEVRAIEQVSGRGRRRPDEPPPFILGQWFEVKLEATAPVDEILEGLLQKGMDRYGRNVTLGQRNSGPQVVVRYRVSALEARLDNAHDDCRAAAWNAWCGDRAEEEAAACISAFPAIAPRLVTRSFTLTSAPLPNGHGGSAPLRLSHPWSAEQLDALDLISPTPVRLHGQIVLDLRGR